MYNENDLKKMTVFELLGILNSIRKIPELLATPLFTSAPSEGNSETPAPRNDTENHPDKATM